MIVQIYEIQTSAEAEAVMSLGVDHVGSVVLSARNWKDRDIRDTVQHVQAAGRISSLIPLFSAIDALRRVLDFYRPDIVHFCEILPWPPHDDDRLSNLLEIQGTIREEYPGVKIMRSIPIGRPGLADTGSTLALASRFEDASDLFLTDTMLPPETTRTAGTQPVDGFVGITGKTCDWETARFLVETSRIPVILAGGLSPDNVRAGIRAVAPAGVDSCTATNQTDTNGTPIRFRKDGDRVRRFVEAARHTT
ncbi:MAG: hypothetical protein QNI85_00340 [Desulfobacterales bacterium]|nr:hypothetical protein [Desulfobacterales bacterium]